MTPYEKVRAMVIEAVPEIEEREDYALRRGPRGGLNIVSEYAPITLADVLRALGKHASGIYQLDQVAFYGDWFHFVTKRVEDGYIINSYWNLAANLEDQEPEVHEFLANLLDV